MSRRSPRALVLWALAVAVAGATALVVGTDLAALHRRATRLGPEVEVAVAARDLPMGTTVGTGDLTTRRVHRDQLPEGTVDLDGARGRVVTVPVVEDGFVAERNLAPPDRTGLDGVVPPGMRIVRVVVDDTHALQPGVAVDVLATFDVAFDPVVASERPEPTVVVAAGVLVIATDDATTDPATGRSGNGVTLLVSEIEARDLAYAGATGVVTVALVPPEDARTPMPE